MKSWKWKIFTPIILISLLVGTKYILWDFPTSNGKRVGNLTKFSKKGKILPTWEGTIDEGSGDTLTSFFSVSDTKLAEELYNYEGKQVVIYYNQYILGWPRDTNYDVTSWKPNDVNRVSNLQVDNVDQDKALNMLSKTLFCSLLGSLYSNSDLYKSVKDHLKDNNLFLYKQVSSCNK